MTGRGQPARTGALRPPTLMMSRYTMDSPRRGRGRPRKYPLTSSLQLLPDDVEYEQEEEEEERIYYDGEEDDEPETEQIERTEQSERDELEKMKVSEEDRIKNIQHAKMMIVTPLGNKRGRGRPIVRKSNQSSSKTTSIQEGPEEIEEDIVEGTSASSATEPVSSEQIQVTEKPESELTEQPKSTTGRPTRARQPTRKVMENINEGDVKPTKPRKSAVPNVVENPVKNEKPISFEYEIEREKEGETGTEQTDDQIEPLLPNEAHIEEPDDVIEKGPETSVPKNVQVVGRIEEVRDLPPPPPKHLLNKAHSRGRPTSNQIPPHRRPVPKDLLPPGLPSHLIARRTVQNTLKDGRRNKEKSEEFRGPSSSMDRSDTLPEHSSMSLLPKHGEAPEIKGSEPRLVKKREAGQDLPDEHMPKQKARHVARAGLVPNMGYEQIKNFELPMHEEMMEHVMDGDRASGSQQRIVRLQDGEFIDERMEREEMIEGDEEKNLMMKGPGVNTRYIEVIEDGMNVVYELDPGDIVEEEDEGEQVVEEESQMAEEQVPEEEYVIEQHVVEEDPVERIAKEADEVMESEIVHHEERIEHDENEIAEDDDELPPQLVPEEVQDDEVAAELERRNEEQLMGAPKKEPLDEEETLNLDLGMMEPGQTFRLSSPGGRSHEVQLARDEDGNNVFIDENGVVVELITDNGTLVEPSGGIESEIQQQIHEIEQQVAPERQNPREGRSAENRAQPPEQLRNVEFNFLDSRNICCGLCGEIVLYENLVNEHLPTAHPEFLQPGVELEEVPYENWLKSRLRQEMKTMQNGFRHFEDTPAEGSGFGGSSRLFSRGLRQLRKVSQIRVNPNEMSLQQLEVALKRKMIEKLGRKVPVSIVDRLHARCDVCKAVVSLNKKFEVIHLVRHFNAWHPSEHRCSNAWKMPQNDLGGGTTKNLSLHDFAVVDTENEQNNLQCIWCGMFMDRSALGMHFSEVHGDQVDVPKCSLCLQEMVLAARLMEKYGEDFGISFPDEFHVESSRLNNKYSSEKSLDKAIERFLKRMRSGTTGMEDMDDDDDRDDEKQTICTTNSQQSFGRRNRLKRKFVKPCFRQICPTNSKYFIANSACEWTCKMCERNVYGAVISAGAIRHYKEFHPREMEDMQYELVKARLERISDGSMEFVHPQLVECLICNLTYALHKPYNICRAIRHLRLKHPEVMPETAGKPISGAEIQETTDVSDGPPKRKIVIGNLITDPVQLERFRRDHEETEFDKVQVIYGVKPNNEPSYILLCEDEVLDQKTAEQVAEAMISNEDNSLGMKKNPNRMANEQQRMFGSGNREFDEEPGSSSSTAGRAIYREGNSGMEEDQFPQQIVEGEELEEETKPVAYIQSYDDNGQPDGIISLDGNEMQEGNYEMIQEEQQYAAATDDTRVQYMTEEELREAEARGDIQIEYVEENNGIVEYEGYEQQ